jgi:hypothetical protein
LARGCLEYKKPSDVEPAVEKLSTVDEPVTIEEEPADVDKPTRINEGKGTQIPVDGSNKKCTNCDEIKNENCQLRKHLELAQEEISAPQTTLRR